MNLNPFSGNEISVLKSITNSFKEIRMRKKSIKEYKGFGDGKITVGVGSPEYELLKHHPRNADKPPEEDKKFATLKQVAEDYKKQRVNPPDKFHIEENLAVVEANKRIELSRIVGLSDGVIKAWEQIGNNLNVEGVIEVVIEIKCITEKLLKEKP